MTRHLLMSQALASALRRRFESVSALAWETHGVHAASIGVDRDVLLLVDDLDSPRAIAAVRQVVSGAAYRTVVLTVRSPCHVWGALLVAGATEVAGVRSVEQLADLVELVAAGEPVMPLEERAELRETWERHVAEDRMLLQRMATLTPRELVVLKALASGSRPRDIGARDGVAQSTVRTQIRSIRRKLDVDSQVRATLVLHRIESLVPTVIPGMPSPRPPQE